MSTVRYVPLRTVAEAVEFQAGCRAGQTAMICAGLTRSYGEFGQASAGIAHAMHDAGLRRGARVAYLGKESVGYYEIFFACARLGTVLVPVNWRLAPAEVEYILRDSGAELLFTERDYLPMVRRLRPDLPRLRQVVDVNRPGGPAAAETPGAGLAAFRSGYPVSWPTSNAGPDDPVVQLYTSGTTGLPKGVVLAHRSFLAIRDRLAASGLPWLDWLPRDRSLICIPGFHVAGLWWAMQGYCSGVVNVAMRAFNAPEAIRLIREQRITTTLAVPAMLRLILAEAAGAAGAGPGGLGSLRLVHYGGSPIDEALLEQCRQGLGCDLAQMYGLTETGNCAVCLPSEDHRPGSRRLRAAGRPYPGVSVKVVDPAGNELPAGEIGEICVHTPAVMLEYWGKPEETRAVLDGVGWLRTGDAGYLDQDGYLYVCDRIKDMVIVAGENVYPAEIENALCKHPAVAEAAVIGVPDPRWGEALHAFVVPRPGQTVTGRQLRVALREHIGDFKIPAKYTFVNTVPRNPSGKILRRQLREQYPQKEASDGRAV